MALAFKPLPDDAQPPSTRPVAVDGLYTGAQVARLVGRSLERLRKVRVAWTRDRDFPAELNEPGEPLVYDAAAVDAWLARRSRRVTAQALPDDAPAAREPAEPDLAAARKGRAQLRLIMEDARC